MNSSHAGDCQSETHVFPKKPYLGTEDSTVSSTNHTKLCTYNGEISISINLNSQNQTAAKTTIEKYGYPNPKLPFPNTSRKPTHQRNHTHSSTGNPYHNPNHGTNSSDQLTNDATNPGPQSTDHAQHNSPRPRKLQLLPLEPVPLNQRPQNQHVPYRRQMSNLTNGFLKMAERQNITARPTNSHFCWGLSRSSSLLPNQRTPPRPNANRPFPPIPRYPPPTPSTVRNRLISLSPTEYIFQTFHPFPHLFSSTNGTQQISIDVRHETEILATGEEFQYKLRMLPQPPVNVITPDLNNLRYPNVGVNLMTSTLNGALLGPDPLISTQIKIMAWNCRGARCHDFETTAR